MASVPKATSIWQEISERGIRGIVDGMSHEECVRITEQYGTHNYHPLPVTIAHAEGAYVFDTTGKKYIDCVGSYSAVAHGHLAPAVVKAAEEQLESVALTSRAVYTREMALFLRALCEYTGADMACPMNTGAEAVETAIKLARKWAYTVKGVPQDKAEIIAFAENFHGRTVTIVGFSTEAQYKQDFGPFTPGFKVVPFGDIEALKAAITPNTAAILMEPIQCEGGILFPGDGFLAAARKLCTEQNVLVIWDEIQTGFCRTGKRFAWEHEDAEPDMMCLGKALGGGIFPVAAVTGKRAVMTTFVPGDHGSTFGGNPLGSAVAVAAIAELEAQGLAENSAAMGKRLLDGMRGLKHDCILDIRGLGLLVGLEVREGTDTKKLAANFLEQGIITKETRHRTFRFAPSLIIGPDEVDEIVSKTDRALAAL